MTSWASPLGAVAALSSSSPLPPVSASPFTSSSPDRSTTRIKDAVGSGGPRERAILFLRVDEALRAVEDTEAGKGKQWLNVQPCVMAASKLCLTCARDHEERLLRLEGQLAEAQRNLSVLANDSSLKEERHTLEQRAHAEEREELRHLCRQLAESLSERCRESEQLREAVGTLGSRLSALERQASADQPREGGLPEGRRHRTRRQEGRGGSPTPLRGRRCRRTRSDDRRDGGVGDTDEEASDSSEDSGKVRKDVEASAIAGLHERVLEEIAQLREQWEQWEQCLKHHGQPSARDRRKAEGDALGVDLWFRRAPPLTFANTKGSGREASPPPSHGFVPFPPQRARWYWSGNGGSHFSNATQQRRGERAALAESGDVDREGNDTGSPALAWDDVRVLDGCSGCWYSAGSWPCEMLSSDGFSPRGDTDQAGAHTANARGRSRKGDAVWKAFGEEYRKAAAAWGCFEWTRPSAIRISRPGVYRFTATLLTSCLTASISAGGGARDDNQGSVGRSSPGGLGSRRHRSCSPASGGHCAVRAPTLALYVDGSRVLTSAASCSSASPNALLLVSRSHRGRNGDSCGYAEKSNGGGDRRRRSPYRGLRAPRPCCTPAPLASYTVSEHCYLREGSVLQVRCHNFHDTRATVEAFLELEYVV